MLEPLLQEGHWPQVGTNSDLPFQDGHYRFHPTGEVMRSRIEHPETGLQITEEVL